MVAVEMVEDDDLRRSECGVDGVEGEGDSTSGGGPDEWFDTDDRRLREMRRFRPLREDLSSFGGSISMSRYSTGGPQFAREDDPSMFISSTSILSSLSCKPSKPSASQ